MKVAVSVPDPVFAAAEREARRMRVPRSQFYSRALEAYLKQRAREDVTRRLNEVYADEATQPDPFLKRAARATLRRNP
jgi:hypothetical protein